MRLTAEDREALVPFECECDLASRCDCARRMVAAVETIVARHVTAALNEAADEIEAKGAAMALPDGLIDRLLRPTWRSVYEDAARIVRAAATRASP